MNIRKISRPCLYLNLVLLAAVSASHPHASELQYTASVTSSYFWRGYSKSDDHLSAQVNLDYSDISNGSGYYLGTWLSSIDFGDRVQYGNAELELIFYGGWSQSLSEEFTLDLQLSHYVFDDSIFGEDADYSELYGFLHYRDLLTAEVAYASDAYSMGSSTLNSQLTFRYPLHTFVDFSAGAGYFSARDVFDYNYVYWNAGFTWIENRFSFDVRYFNTRETSRKITYSGYRSYGQSSQYRQRLLAVEEFTTVLTLSTSF